MLPSSEDGLSTEGVRAEFMLTRESLEWHTHCEEHAGPFRCPSRLVSRHCLTVADMAEGQMASFLFNRDVE